jgi:hypothetical protein
MVKVSTVTASSSAIFVKGVIQWSHGHFLSCHHYHGMFQVSRMAALAGVTNDKGGELFGTPFSFGL